MLDRLLDFIDAVWRKGITEDTFQFRCNYGWLGDRLIQLDVGELRQGKRQVAHERHRRAILEEPQTRWLRNLNPTLADYLEAQVHRRGC